jgi:hypothetical protein
MGINILPLIDEVLGDTLDARKVIRSQALLTCWTWRQHDSCHCLQSTGDLKEQVYFLLSEKTCRETRASMADPASHYKKVEMCEN